MARKLIRKTKIYNVDWYLSNGFCYRTTTKCKWADVLQCKKVAAMLGETIKYEHVDTIIDEYIITP